MILIKNRLDISFEITNRFPNLTHYILYTNYDNKRRSL